MEWREKGVKTGPTNIDLKWNTKFVGSIYQESILCVTTVCSYKSFWRDDSMQYNKDIWENHFNNV